MNPIMTSRFYVNRYNASDFPSDYSFLCSAHSEWCSRNWGTKWNAYDFQPLREDSDTMVFFTAWSSVPKIVELLSKEYPEQTITYRWADENIGYNVGESTLKGGEVIDFNVPIDGSREAYEMAAEIMEIDLSDFNLHLTKDETSYEYRDPDEQEQPQQHCGRQSAKKPKDRDRRSEERRVGKECGS